MPKSRKSSRCRCSAPVSSFSHSARLTISLSIRLPSPRRMTVCRRPKTFLSLSSLSLGRESASIAMLAPNRSLSPPSWAVDLDHRRIVCHRGVKTEAETGGKRDGCMAQTFHVFVVRFGLPLRKKENRTAKMTSMQGSIRPAPAGQRASGMNGSVRNPEHRQPRWALAQRGRDPFLGDARLPKFKTCELGLDDQRRKHGVTQLPVAGKVDAGGFRK